MPPVRTIRSMVTLGVAIAVALVCVRLGIWQTRRLGERRAHNARLWARMADPVIGLAEVGTDTAGTRYRRVRVEGPARYDREVAWGPRMRNGSPGAHLLTPVPYRGDTMVLVDRGWARDRAYAAVQRAAAATWDEGASFRERIAADAEVASALAPADLEACFDVRAGLGNLDVVFERLAAIEA